VKKALYLAAARRLGLYRDVVFHASTSREEKEIRHGWSKGARIAVASNLVNAPDERPRPTTKEEGSVRFVYVGRIARKKNVHTAIEMLGSLQGRVTFDLYGPLEDAAYWQECLELIGQLPEHVVVQHRGNLLHDRVADTLREYHVFLFPTLGENFGHAIVESLQVGRPVMISDRTPWHDLAERGAGWDLSLADHGGWRTALKMCVEMGDAEFQRMCQGAHEMIGRWRESSSGRADNIELFRHAITFWSMV